MSDVIEQAVSALNKKMAGAGFDGSAKFIIDGEGAIMLGPDGARAADEDADVTLTASTDTFRDLLEGNLNPTSAFMTGRLKIDGDMGAAMRLAPALS